MPGRHREYTSMHSPTAGDPSSRVKTRFLLGPCSETCGMLQPLRTVCGEQKLATACFPSTSKHDTCWPALSKGCASMCGLQAGWGAAVHGHRSIELPLVVVLLGVQACRSGGTGTADHGAGSNTIRSQGRAARVAC